MSRVLWASWLSWSELEAHDGGDHSLPFMQLRELWRDMLALPAADFPRRNNPLSGALELWIIIEQSDLSTDDVEYLLEDDGMTTSSSSNPEEHYQAVRAACVRFWPAERR